MQSHMDADDAERYCRPSSALIVKLIADSNRQPTERAMTGESRPSDKKK